MQVYKLRNQYQQVKRVSDNTVQMYQYNKNQNEKRKPDTPSIKRNQITPQLLASLGRFGFCLSFSDCTPHVSNNTD